MKFHLSFTRLFIYASFDVKLHAIYAVQVIIAVNMLNQISYK